MKKYVKKIEKKMKAIQKNQEKDDIDFIKSLDHYICPYCGFDVVMALPRRMKDDNSAIEIFRSECVGCGTVWTLELNRNGEFRSYKNGQPDLLNPDGII